MLTHPWDYSVLTHPWDYSVLTHPSDSSGPQSVFFIRELLQRSPSEKRCLRLCVSSGDRWSHQAASPRPSRAPARRRRLSRARHRATVATEEEEEEEEEELVYASSTSPPSSLSPCLARRRRGEPRQALWYRGNQVEGRGGGGG